MLDNTVMNVPAKCYSSTCILEPTILLKRLHTFPFNFSIRSCTGVNWQIYLIFMTKCFQQNWKWRNCITVELVAPYVGEWYHCGDTKVYDIGGCDGRLRYMTSRSCWYKSMVSIALHGHGDTVQLQWWRGGEDCKGCGSDSIWLLIMTFIQSAFRNFSLKTIREEVCNSTRHNLQLSWKVLQEPFAKQTWAVVDCGCADRKGHYSSWMVKHTFPLGQCRGVLGFLVIWTRKEFCFMLQCQL